MKKSLEGRLIKDWHRAHRLWRVRAGLGWAALSGLYGCWGALQDHLPVGLYVSLSIAMSVAITSGHLLKLPGATDGN